MKMYREWKDNAGTGFSRALCLENHRVQFTPDVLPADILGFSMYDKEQGGFYYHPGAVMCNLFWQMKSTVLLKDPVSPVRGYGRGEK